MSPTPPPPGTRTSAGATARPGKPSRWWGVVGAVVAALVAAGIIWWTNGFAERIDATTVGYKVDSDRQVTVRFDVSRPPGQPVTCTVTAQDGTFAAVGSAQLVIPTGGERTTAHVVTVRTASRAVTGNVTDCVRTAK